MQNVDNPVNIIYAALAVVGAIGSGYAWLKMQPSRDADAASVLTGAALQMVNELQEQYQKLRLEFDSYKLTTDERIAEQATIIAQQAERISALEKENQALRTENNRLKSPAKRRGNL